MSCICSPAIIQTRIMIVLKIAFLMKKFLLLNTGSINQPYCHDKTTGLLRIRHRPNQLERCGGKSQWGRGGIQHRPDQLERCGGTFQWREGWYTAQARLARKMWWQVLVGGGVVEFSELTSKISSFGFNAYPYCNFSLTGQFFLESNHRYSFAKKWGDHPPF